MKKTWKLLPKIFGDQFRITEGEAIQILQEQLFSKNWKHGKAGKLGRMWTDPVIINEFNSLLKAEDKIAKTITRKKVQQELFKSAACLRFCQVAGLKYRGYLNFKNDYAKWKRLPMFSPSWKKGTITIDKVRKKLAAKNKKLN
ncbi:MAG TPA: hypothetical protein DCS66_20385 [Flavobacteriaceae bacterium]|nr:hypothetical protein [Flavobacteriaceae bacterium]|tara:strand:+ start:141 stop:569 length:429 start_codon:yes stop_codon:yes gene_type:complete